jgi:hypothetical protein
VAFQILSGKGCETWSAAAFTIHRRRGKPATLSAVYAQTIEQNIGQPL